MKERKDDLNDNRKAALLFREAELSVRAGADGGEGEVRASVSSETPYYRRGIRLPDGGFRDGYEILGHGEGEVDFSRMRDGLVIQDTHWGDQVGIIREPAIEGGKLGGVVEFGCGPRAKEIEQDAAAGIRRNMSVGYTVNRYERAGEAGDGLPVFRAVSWTPYEASFVNVPADTAVGVGRSLETAGTDTAAKPAAGKERETEMDKPETTAQAAPAGVTADEVRGIVTEAVSALREEIARKPATPARRDAPVFDEDGNREIARRYNLVNVIRALAGDRSADIGFEREVSDELVRAGRKTRGDIVVPEAALLRAFDKGAAAAGLVATDTLFGNAIEALVAETVLGEAGVTTLTGLVGDVSVPKLGSATAYWVSSEGGDATESTPAVGQVLGTPHTIGAYTDITRKLLNQSGISAQNFIADALRSALARGIEAAAFAGTGSSGQPTGLENTAGVNSVSMTAGSPTKDDMVDFWQKLYTANVNGEKRFIGSPAVKALLCKTLDVQSELTSGHYLCENDLVEGYEFLMSNLCGSKKLYFGDWSQLVLAFWSGLDLTVDTSSLSKSGGVRVVALQDMDVLVRQPAAFAVGTALS